MGERQRVLPGDWGGEAPCPAHRDSVVEFLWRLERRGIKDGVVEEAEVESHLPVGAHQSRLTLEARVRPVLRVQSVDF